jgi:tRNA dimethylallyltransferase
MTTSPLPSPEFFADALILSGPTASGKTAVGVELAERLQAEILSVDALAVYRGLDIGTAKPTATEQTRVRHHLIDWLDPWDVCSVASWLRAAAQAAADARHRGRRLLLVGGTPLYLVAIMRGLFTGPGADPALRAELARLSDNELLEQVRRVDPDAASRISPADRRRLIRVLEVWRLTGRPLSAWQCEFARPRPRQLPGLWLDWPRAALHDRINRRVEQMFAAGLIEECRRLLNLGRPLSPEVCRAAGYAEAFAYLEGRLTLSEAIKKTQARTRQLAKRQITWLRHLPELQSLPISSPFSPTEVVNSILRRWHFAQ